MNKAFEDVIKRQKSLWNGYMKWLLLIAMVVAFVIKEDGYFFFLLGIFIYSEGYFYFLSRYLSEE